jgi:hypothetical protein
VRNLRGVIEREKAEIGVLISMEPPSKHQASAAPLVPNSTGVRYFCSFEDDAFR